MYAIYSIPSLNDPPTRSMDSEERKAEERRKPNWGQSGLLAAATNTVQRADGSATVLKYNEPPEARKPVESWRLYEFKDDDITGM
jgi:smad nuclear-interacting protein 1